MPTIVGTSHGIEAFIHVKSELINPDTHEPIGPKSVIVTVAPTIKLTNGTEKNFTALGDTFCIQCSTMDMNHTPSIMGMTDDAYIALVTGRNPMNVTASFPPRRLTNEGYTNTPARANALP